MASVTIIFDSNMVKTQDGEKGFLGKYPNFKPQGFASIHASIEKNGFRLGIECTI